MRKAKLTQVQQQCVRAHEAMAAVRWAQLAVEQARPTVTRLHPNHTAQRVLSEVAKLLDSAHDELDSTLCYWQGLA